MSALAATSTTRDTGTVAALCGGAPVCLVVHDDLGLRLQLADLVRRAAAPLNTDTVALAGLDQLPLERMRAYVAVLLILDFNGGVRNDPLAVIARLKARVSRLPLLVFARNGDERWAARSMKLGVADYWPIHAVDVAELAAALQSLLAPPLVPPLDPPRPATGLGSARLHSQALPEIAGYRLLKKLAQSSVAAVYLASNDDLPQTVALKIHVLKNQDHLSEADRQNFTRECEILSSLNHRSVADVIDFGITQEHLYLALEYFPCGSLRERLKNPVSEAEALNYARQIAEALQVVHAAGIVHRDLKPSNLMLSADNRIVLIDFGSARAPLTPRDLSRSDLPTGTPYYVCPEQLEGRESEPRGDLYSLGIIFFEMLAGRLPFRGHTLAQIFECHRTADVPRLAPAQARFQPMIDRLLAKDPKERYASAAHFLDALRTQDAASAKPIPSPAPMGALDQ